MESFNIDLELIRGYVNGTLPAGQLKSLEQRLSQDPEFAEEFQLQVEMAESVVLLHRQELKQTLKKQDLNTKTTRSTNPFKQRWFMAAASLALMALAAYFLLRNDTDPQSLYANHYQPYYNILTENQRSNDTVSTLMAMRWYDEGDYQKALNALEKVEAGPDPKLIDFYKGICLLELNRSDQAIAIFNDLITGTDFELSEASYWYLGLSYLKTNSIQDAKQVFTNIVATSGAYKQRAQEILDEL